MLKFYPDRRIPAIWRFVKDLAALCWVAAWGFAGYITYQTVEALQVIADGLRDTGRTFNDWLTAFRSSVPRNIPYLSDWLLQQANALQKHTGDELIGLSVQVHQQIDQLAIFLSLFIALPPILLVVFTYGVWRWRDAREMGSALAFVRIAERSGRAEQARALLAYRALATLSFTQLMKASDDPVGDITHHRYETLASAMLDRAGLDPWRLHATPPPDQKRLSQPIETDLSGG